jgi:hypothetical protein
VGEGFEARPFLHDLVRARFAPARRAALRLRGKEAECALLPKTAGEVAHSFGVSLRFLGALRCCAIFEEDHGTNQLIAPLDVIDKAELELVEIWHRAHPHFSPPTQLMIGWLRNDETTGRLPSDLLTRLEVRLTDGIWG